MLIEWLVRYRDELLLFGFRGFESGAPETYCTFCACAHLVLAVRWLTLLELVLLTHVGNLLLVLLFVILSVSYFHTQNNLLLLITFPSELGNVCVSVIDQRDGLMADRNLLDIVAFREPECASAFTCVVCLFLRLTRGSTLNLLGGTR